MNDERQAEKLQVYYKWHAPFYDATRWSFLFGRQRLMDTLPDLPPEPRILEVGCGTGRNLRLLTPMYPEAHITGIDLSDVMLRYAARKMDHHPHVNLLQGRYGSAELSFDPFDLIILSYSITMMGSRLEPILQQLTNDLKADGHIAVVDFHRTPHRWFQQWMNANHVQMDGSLLPLLKQHYRSLQTTIYPAYLGWWQYFLFVGKGS